MKHRYLTFDIEHTPAKKEMSRAALVALGVFTALVWAYLGWAGIK